MPNLVIGYYWPDFAIDVFNNFPNFGLASIGLQAKADVFLRYQWEVSRNIVGKLKKYALLFNSGDYSLFYLPTIQVVFWDNNGELIKKHPSSRQERKQYFIEGLAFGERGEFLDTQLLRKDHIHSMTGVGVLLDSRLIDNRWYYLALLNTKFIQFLVNLYCGQHKVSGYVNLVPIPRENKKVINDLSDNSRHHYYLKSTWYLGDETNYQFEKPWIILWKEKDGSYCGVNDILDVLINHEKKTDKELEKISAEIDSKTLELYGVTDPEDMAIVEKAVERRPKDVLWKETKGYSEEQKKVYHTESLLSFWIGCLFGRWDAINGSFYDGALIHDGKIYDLREAIRKKADEFWDKDEIIAEPTKFALSKEEITSCPKVAYPFSIDPDGIIPLDEGHSEDLVKQIEIAAEITFGSENVEEVIKEIESILGQDLRAYFTRRFFESHANRYLRKPIYWLLQSPTKKYSIYVYYHKIDHDTLLKIVRNYVEPKINMLADEYKDIKAKIESSEGAEKRRLEKRQAELFDVMLDIVNFKDSINKLVAQGLELNIDDGIAVNIAPFKDVIPWNEVQKYWSNLESGECDWSKLAMKYWPERVKAKCKKDKSLAIAHGCE